MNFEEGAGTATAGGAVIVIEVVPLLAAITIGIGCALAAMIIMAVIAAAMLDRADWPLVVFFPVAIASGLAGLICGYIGLT